jgi:hypothetical protein
MSSVLSLVAAAVDRAEVAGLAVVVATGGVEVVATEWSMSVSQQLSLVFGGWCGQQGR